MATPKKKHLIELMIEAGVKWLKGAEYAAQDKRNGKLHFFKMKPIVRHGDEHFCAPGGSTGYPYSLPSLCHNWHQTIVTREQYAEAMAERDGWIQWKGGERPVHRGCPVEVKLRNGDTVRRDAGNFSWWYLGCRDADIIAYRVIEKAGNPSIEQLTADYHDKAAEADRLQSVADDALLALEKAGELLGLVISIDTKPKHVEQQCSSAEWKIGDKCIVTDSPDDAEWVGRECVLTKIDRSDNNLTYRVESKDRDDYWVSGIRRP